MRIEIGIVCSVLLLAGCAHPKPPANTAAGPEKKNAPAPAITPNFATVGRVEMVNMQGRFVVLSFPPGHVPPPGQRWRIVHQGLKIGEVRISGPQREVDTVADITEGEAHTGDDAAQE